MRVELEVLNWKSCNRKRLTDLGNKLRVAGGKGYLGTLGRS